MFGYLSLCCLRRMIVFRAGLFVWAICVLRESQHVMCCIQERFACLPVSPCRTLLPPAVGTWVSPMPAVKAKAAKLPTCRSHFPQHLFRLHPYHA